MMFDSRANAVQMDNRKQTYIIENQLESTNRKKASQAEGRGIVPRLPLTHRKLIIISNLGGYTFFRFATFRLKKTEIIPTFANYFHEKRANLVQIFGCCKNYHGESINLP